MQKIYCVFLNSSKEFVKIVSSPTAKYGCVIKYVFVHHHDELNIFSERYGSIADSTQNIGNWPGIPPNTIYMALLGIVKAAYHLRELGK